MKLKAIKILRKELNEWKKYATKNVYNNNQKYRKMVDTGIAKYATAIAELEALENRKCTDCKFFTKNNAFYGVCAKDVNTTKNQDEWLSNIEFSCNRFEQKES